MGARFLFVLKCGFSRVFDRSARARSTRSLALMALALGLQGCAAGVIGAILGGASGGGGGGGSSAPVPATVAVESVEFPGVAALPTFQSEAPSCPERSPDPLLGCNLSPEDRASIEKKLADALGLDNRARQNVRVQLSLDRDSTVAFLARGSGGGVLDASRISVDGSPLPGTARAVKKGKRTLELEVGAFGLTSPETVNLEITPEGGTTVTTPFLVDNRPPASITLCNFRPGFSCGSNAGLAEPSTCSLVLPPGSPEPKLRVALFKTDATGSCATLDGEPIEVETFEIAPGTGSCAANLEAKFSLPGALDCQSASVILAVAEVSGLDSEAGPGPSIQVSGAVGRVDSSAPDLADMQITSFQPGSRIHTEDLFGIAVIDYTVKDQGGEPVNVDIAVTIPNVGTLRASDGTLTEYRGAPCEGILGEPSDGIRCLTTSPVGERHRFLWNLDFDFDRLVREKRLTTPRRTGVRIEITLEDTQTDRLYDTIRQERTIDNSTLHTVAGLQPGQTAFGDDSISADQITFETVSGLDIDATTGDPAFYFVDSGTHTLWKWRLSAPEEVTRIAGTGALRTEPAVQFDGRIASNAILRQPIDVLTDSSGVVFLLERSGRALWRIADDNIELLLDERVLRNAEQMALDKASGILYIADSGNCRILRCDLSRLNPDTPEEGVTVISGDLRVLQTAPLFQRLFADAPAVFDERRIDGCNFRDLLAELELTPEGVPAPGAGILDTPEGIAFYSSPSGDVLFVSDTGTPRVVRLSSEAPDPGTTLTQLVDRLPGGRNLCTPASLTVASGDGSPALFISLRGFIEANVIRGTKGIIVRAPIVDTGDNSPTLGELEPIAGIDDFAKGDCGPQNQASTYRPEDECLPATAAPLSLPEELGFDGAGIAYVTDSRNQQVRKIGAVCPSNPSGEDRIAKLFGTGVEGISPCEETASPGALCEAGPPAEAPISSRLDDPLGLLLFGDERVLLTDRGNNRLRLLDLRTGSAVTLAGRPRTAEEERVGLTFAGDGGPALNALFKNPRSPAVAPTRDWCGSPDRKIYIADTGNHLVRVVDANGNIDTAVGVFNLPPGQGPQGEGENRDLGSSGLAPDKVILKFPKHLLVDSRGRILISDSGRHRILQLENGLVRRVLGVGSTFVDRENENERPVPAPDPLVDGSLGPAGQPGVGDGGPPLLARLNTPNEMAFDEDEERLYFCDGNNHRVRRVRYDAGTGDLLGPVESVAGTGSNLPVGPQIPSRARRLAISFPYGLAFSRDSQFLYCTETFGFSRIYRVQLQADLQESRVCRIAGAVTFGAAGDGDDAVNAQFLNPNSLQVDGAGNLYVLDGRNHRLRKFFPLSQLCTSSNP